MSAPLTTDPGALAGGNYESLRREGLAHLRALAGETWTDHNAHDPGITLLEALSYALADLDYRTALPLPDLLTPNPADPRADYEDGLHPAHEVLPNAPLTRLDYRGLLAAVEGVRNAWLSPAEAAGPRVYFGSGADGSALTLTPPDGRDGGDAAGFHVRGLYRVLLELEVDPELGPLGERALETRIDFSPNDQRVGPPLRGVTVRVVVPDLDSLPDDLTLAAPQAAATVEPADPPGTRPRDAGRRWRGVVTPGGGGVAFAVELEVVDAQPSGGAAPTAVTAEALADALLDVAGTERGGDPRRAGLVRRVLRKRATAAEVYRRAEALLHANRNLCEDFLPAQSVPTMPVAVCVDVHVGLETDIERLYAEIALALEDYLNPPLRRYGLAELLAEGTPVEEIYAGPYVKSATPAGAPVSLRPGFVRPADLAATELRTGVYASDIVNLLADLPGVRSLEHLMLLGQATAAAPAFSTTHAWRLDVVADHQPTLALARSRITFYKEGIPYTPKDTEARATLGYLRAVRREAAAPPPGERLVPPAGRFRDPGAYYPVQDDLPENYGVGVRGLPAGATPARRAQAHQLKSYLLVYEQVIADYLQQLAGAGRLLSPDLQGKPAYPSRFLGDGVMTGVGDSFAAEHYIDPVATQDVLARGGLYERTEDAAAHRHRILDHLLARFAEDFTTYGAALGRALDDSSGAAADLAEDKSQFLLELPQLARERSRALDYRTGDPGARWDTEANLAGATRRIARLLGFADVTRRDLHCALVDEQLIEAAREASGWVVRVPAGEPPAEPLLIGVIGVGDEASASAAAAALGPSLGVAGAYAIERVGDADFRLSLSAANGPSLRHREPFASRAAAEQRVRRLLRLYRSTLHEEQGPDDRPGCAAEAAEGLYLIEHVLLRPLSTDAPDAALLRVCDPAGACPADDPYSFRVSVVLPYWPRRLRDLDFRNYLERVVRLELPAHVHARICWADNAQLRELGARWRAFLAELDRRPRDPAAYDPALVALAAALDRLATVYPEATLHDCEEDAGDAPVQLGRTRLGFF